MIKKTLIFCLVFLTVISLYAGKRKKNSNHLPLFFTQWHLEEVYEKPIVQSIDTAFIIFDENSKFSGNLGCNLFFGEFTFSKKRIKLDYFGATKKYCKDSSVEELFAKALRDDITHYIIENNKLYLRNKTQIICKFEGVISSIKTEFLNQEK